MSRRYYPALPTDNQSKIRYRPGSPGSKSSYFRNYLKKKKWKAGNADGYDLLYEMDFHFKPEASRIIPMQ